MLNRYFRMSFKVTQHRMGLRAVTPRNNAPAQKHVSEKTYFDIYDGILQGAKNMQMDIDYERQLLNKLDTDTNANPQFDPLEDTINDIELRQKSKRSLEKRRARHKVKYGEMKKQRKFR